MSLEAGTTRIILMCMMVFGRCRTSATRVYAAGTRSSTTVSSSANGLVITIVDLLDGWRVLVCFGYATVEFVYSVI